MPPRPELPVEALSAWSLLNNVTLLDVKVVKSREKGLGVVSERDLSTVDGTYDIPTLITVPSGLILNHEAVEEHAKEDRNFRQLLDTAGHQSNRTDVLLFLLVQLVQSPTEAQRQAGVSNPWTGYTQFLPSYVPVPTLWTEGERELLEGTSLESALNAKTSALVAEFDYVREKSCDLPYWNDVLWESGAVRMTDWLLVDAWYRSRCLSLPRSGEALVPCIDLVNHSSNPTAYYEQTSRDEVTLLLRPGTHIHKGEEITISYGDDKPAAEMLFSYGFVDPNSRTRNLVLPLETLEDDPLAKAKSVAYHAPPTVRVWTDEEQVRWESPFAYLMCVNEEDGLEFRVLQDTRGGRQLRVFWMEEDVTERTKDFDMLTRSHPLRAIFQLRVVTVVQDCLQNHLQRMQSKAAALSSGHAESLREMREECVHQAALLRDIESELLEAAVHMLENEKLALASDADVVAYLGSMEPSESGLGERGATNEEDEGEVEDFS
ncbi:hypothetical protein VTK73DRAFT_7549 [Phialemonium thermophilum]|uniref:SET domain-containing protein n=1 Tax=Phialemonium thermophilum TaxID=223376 RepID=A0ABR3XS10_9PEZI